MSPKWWACEITKLLCIRTYNIRVYLCLTDRKLTWCRLFTIFYWFAIFMRIHIKSIITCTCEWTNSIFKIRILVCVSYNLLWLAFATLLAVMSSFCTFIYIRTVWWGAVINVLISFMTGTFVRSISIRASWVLWTVIWLATLVLVVTITTTTQIISSITGTCEWTFIIVTDMTFLIESWFFEKLFQ